LYTEQTRTYTEENSNKDEESYMRACTCINVRSKNKYMANSPRKAFEAKDFMFNIDSFSK
jgi:hypothetical protein